MENLCDELDTSKAEIAELREESMAKTKLCDSLRTAHARQVAEVGEARLRIESQARELSEKSEEISDLRQLYEDLKADMQRKDSFLRDLRDAHDKLRLDFGEKVFKLEGENREMGKALDEATSRIKDLENQIDAANLEIGGLKRVLSVQQKKDDKDVEAVQVLKERDDIIIQLEEEKRVTDDQLKWKSEQFKHLEEAHEKVHDNFQRSMIESEKEKSAMIEEITSLQASLDSQTRISESFQAQLKICHQTLAHEESRRKVLEIELDEFRSRYEDVFSECKEAKSRLEQMDLKRDEEIGELRNLARTKETLCKEMNYRATHLEQENQELLALLKELQEAQLCGVAATTSLKELKKELTGLQVLHSKCSIDLNEKESNWNSQMEKLKGDLRFSLSELEGKDEHIKEMQKELDTFHESFESRTEEISLLVAVFKSELNLIYSKLLSGEAEEQRIGSSNELNKTNSEFTNTSHEKLLLEIIEEQKRRIAKLHDEIGLRDMTIILETEAAEALKQENEEYKEIAKGLNISMEHLENEIARLKLELSELELEHLKLSGLKISFEKEKRELLQIVQEKDERIHVYQEEAKSQEKNFTDAMTSRTEKQLMLEHALERLENQKILEMEDKSKIITHLETEARDLQQKLESQGVAFLHSQEELIHLNTSLQVSNSEMEEKSKIITHLETEARDLRQKLKSQGVAFRDSEEELIHLNISLQATKSEMEDLKNMFENEKLHIDGVMKDLMSHNKALGEHITELSDGREGLLSQMERMSEQLDVLCSKDAKLSESLGRMTQYCEVETGIFSTTCRNAIAPFSPSRKSTEANPDERPPLTELNRDVMNNTTVEGKSP